MSRERRQLGKHGEEMARRHMENNGYTIVESNYRTGSGEVDLIARSDGVLTFVEVRTRRGAKFGSPEESITPDKRAHLVAVAQEYLAENDLQNVEWRIDVVAVELSPRGKFLRLDVIENAVEM